MGALVDFGKPKNCAECGSALQSHSHAGRPRVVCSIKCANARRLAQLRADKAADEANAAYLVANAEFFQGRGK